MTNLKQFWQILWHTWNETWLIAVSLKSFSFTRCWRLVYRVWINALTVWISWNLLLPQLSHEAASVSNWLWSHLKHGRRVLTAICIRGTAADTVSSCFFYVFASRPLSSCLNDQVIISRDILLPMCIRPSTQTEPASVSGSLIWAVPLLHPISLSHVAALGCLIVLFCHLFTVDPLSLPSSVCSTETPRVYFEHTHAHTRTFQNTKHTPQVRWDAVQNEQNLQTVWSLVISVSRSQKHTFTLADNNRLAQFRSISITKIIDHMIFFCSHPDKLEMSQPWCIAANLSNGQLSAF